MGSAPLNPSYTLSAADNPDDPPAHSRSARNAVIPAKAEIHGSANSHVEKWIPAFAGMTILQELRRRRRGQ
jgi:hypothetical protein